MFLPHILEISFDILPSINARHKNHHQAKAQGLVDVSRGYYTNQKIPLYPPRRSTSRGWVTVHLYSTDDPLSFLMASVFQKSPIDVMF